VSWGLHKSSKILTQHSPHATNCLPQTYGYVFCVSLYKVRVGQKRFPLLLNGISVIVFLNWNKANSHSGAWLMQCNPRGFYACGAVASLTSLCFGVADCDLHFSLGGSGMSRSSHQRPDVLVQTMRHELVRWRLVITTLLQIQYGVFGTCYCFMGWNSLLFTYLL